MKDRFKFRIWDKKEKEMTEWPGNGVLNSNYFLECLKDKNCIVLQSTGLKDRNKKEIFEGDIVEYASSQYICYGQYTVIFRNGAFMVTDSDTQVSMDIFNGKKIGKIIGNIYKNPNPLQ